MSTESTQDLARATDGAADNPYETAAPAGNDNWLNGPDAVQPNEALQASATEAASVDADDPYAISGATDSNDSWLNGPDAVVTNEALGDAAATGADAGVAALDSGSGEGLSFSQLFDGSLPVQDWINQ